MSAAKPLAFGPTPAPDAWPATGSSTPGGGPTVRDHFAHLASPDGLHGYEPLAHHRVLMSLERRLQDVEPVDRIALLNELLAQAVQDLREQR